MSYVLKSNHRNPKNPLSHFLKIFGGFLVLLIVIYGFFPSLLPSFFTTLIKPLWNIEQGVRHGDSSIEELRKVYADMEAESSKNNILLLENEDLKNLLGRSTVSHPLLATVLKKPPFSAYDTFVLDVGSENHVQKGDRVYALGMIPIGEIVDVVNGTSKVLLYSSAGEKFMITIATSSIQTTGMGMGGGYFEASVPRSTKIVTGDPVFIPSLSDSFFGTVESLVSDPSEPFSKILFRQPFNIYELRWVLVDTK